MNEATPRVVIGMDPHKRSVTIEVMTADETVLGGGRYATGEAGYAERPGTVASCSTQGHCAIVGKLQAPDRISGRGR